MKNETLRQIALNHRLDVKNIDESEKGFERIRSMLNAAVYSDAEDWMKPNWVLKKSEKTSNSDLLSNDEERHWILVGSPGGKKFGVIDSKGLVTANPNCGSIDFMIQDNDSIMFPALEEGNMELLSSNDQIFQWSKQVGAVEFSRFVYHTTKGKKEAIVNEIHLQNLSMEIITCTFYIALRPMSVLGIEPISSTHYDHGENVLFGNREVALIAKTRPTAVIMQSGDNPNLIDNMMNAADRNDSEFSAALGLATAVLRYDVTLKPSRSGTFFFVSPTEQIKQGESIPQYSEHSKMRDSAIASWYSFSEDTSSGRFPNREIDDAFAQAKANVAIQARSLLLPKDETYPLSWRESTRVLVALNRIGGLGLAKDISLRLSRIIKPSAEYLDEKLVPLAWGILEHYQCTRELTFLKLMRPFLNKIFSLLITEIQKDLQEKATLIEEYETTDQEAITMLWRFAALLSASIFYQALEEPSQIDELSDIIAKYEIHLIDTLHEMKITKDENLVEIIGTSALLGLTDLAVGRMNEILDQISSTVISKGLVKTDEKEILSSHLALRVAHYYVVERQNYAVERLLNRALRYLTPYHLLPEYVNSQTEGGSKGDGSSLMASVDFILLVREMVVFSAQKVLAILPGVPDSWHDSTSPMVMEKIPTSVGEVQIEMGVSSNQNQIEIIMREHLPDELVVYFPTYYTLHMIKVFGGAPIERVGDESCAFVRLVPLSNNVVLTYRRQ